MRRSYFFSVSVRSADCCLVAEIDGELDMATADQFLDTLSAYQYEHIILDCRALAFIDSMGISAWLHLVNAGKGVALVALKPHIEKILAMMGIDSLISWCDELDQARASLHGTSIAV